VSDAGVATAGREEATFLEAGDETIVAVLNSPTTDARGVGVVFLPGGGAPTTTGRNRFAVRLCRLAAAAGFHAVRIDYHGAGESTGAIHRLRLDQPFVADTEAAISLLEAQGVDRIVLVGSCFGARTAASAAVLHPDVVALALISPPVRDFEMGQHSSVLAAERRSVWAYLAKGLHPRSLARLTSRQWRSTYRRHAGAKWRQITRKKADRPNDTDDDGRLVSRRFLQELRDLVDRGAELLLLYGSDEYLYEDFEQARAGRLGRVLERSGATIEVLPGSVHGFTRLAAQDDVLASVMRWLESPKVREATSAVGRSARAAADASSDPNDGEPRTSVKEGS
jgi:pimeloyl-ACP methyl ester carboxylesterase